LRELKNIHDHADISNDMRDKIKIIIF